MTDFPVEKKIILFDGVCNLCNNAVQTVIKYDKKNQYVFTSLQSETGKQILQHLKIDTEKVDSIILYDPSIAYYIKSSAAIKIMNSFSGAWKLTHALWIFPTSFRDFIYDFIAKNRYKWFGKKKECMLPTPNLKSKFLP